MKIWTQAEFDKAKAGMHGVLELGTGDFTKVQFRGAHNLVIGPRSTLGAHAHLGVNCEIGHHTAVGDGFLADGALIIGEHCHFGTDADLGECARIGRASCFGSRAVIKEGSQLADDVSLPNRCTLFGVQNADGRTVMKLFPVVGSPLYAFAADGEKGESEVWVCMKQMRRTLDEFEEFAADQATMHGMTGTREFITDGHQLLAAAKYVRARFSLQKLCAAFRRSI